MDSVYIDFSSAFDIILHSLLLCKPTNVVLSLVMLHWAPFPGVKQPVHGVDHPHPSSTEIKERVSYTFTLLLDLNVLF
jgi:hypothetical protein